MRNMRHHRGLAGWVVALLLLCVATGTSGKTGRLVVGGDRGMPWDQVVMENVALEYHAGLGGAIQPRELRPPRFEITDLSLENLKSDRVPDDVLKKLESIKNQRVQWVMY